MAAFAIMLRRLLAAVGASVGLRPMLATAHAANAVSGSVPLAGRRDRRWVTSGEGRTPDRSADILALSSPVA